MVKKGIGGANTKTGLAFEGEKELFSFFKKQENYEIKNMIEIQNKNKNDAFELFYKGNHVANIFKKHAIYVYLKKYHNLNWNIFLSKKLLPDDSIFVYKNNTFLLLKLNHKMLLAVLMKNCKLVILKENNDKNFYQY